MDSKYIKNASTSSSDPTLRRIAIENERVKKKRDAALRKYDDQYKEFEKSIRTQVNVSEKGGCVITTVVRGNIPCGTTRESYFAPVVDPKPPQSMHKYYGGKK